MKWLVSAVAVATVLVGVVLGYPTGAPEESCNDMVPDHPGSNSSVEPFLLLTDTSQSNQIKVTLKPKNSGVTFKGFLLRVTMDPEASGSFDLSSTPEYQTICTNSTMSAVTHRNRREKSIVEVVWKVDSGNTFTFDATVVIHRTEHVLGLHTVATV